MSSPKVLILNQPFVSDTGGGITLSNLFSKWSSEQIAVACSGYLLKGEIESTKCNKYYQLGSDERKWIFPLNLIRRKYQSGEVRFTDQTKDKVVAEEDKSVSRTNFTTKYVEPFFYYFGLTHFISKTILSPQIREWLTNFNPDVIYAQSTSREEILFCIAVQEYLKKPMVFHKMDDWLTLSGNKSFMKNYWRKKINKEFKQLLNHSKLVMSISDYMGEEYQKRYNKEFITFHNPIDIDFWKTGQRLSYELSSSPTIMYAGRIGLGIDNSLMTIAAAIDKVNDELNMSINFMLQAPGSPEWLGNYKCTKFKKFVPYSELPSVFGGADFMILPYDFDPNGLAFIKYSMPTKASEYMASGTPIIIFAPEDTALVQYAKKKSWAAVVTNNDCDELANKIKKLVVDLPLRENFAITAKKLAEERHNTDLVATEFRACIESVIK
ncbi:glycosyltransferase [Aurantibacter crassamenti]|uniref:glycosyltransferase n=1 Tax=Aurantibacter crassamenti TaxID=1837375 RepID=UPI00193AA4A0|nr:glycosyltransferase [Aurantibacter crassamenti]MBM1105815.1 glycosyltransferase [Aurantibacter crassamenti]